MRILILSFCLVISTLGFSQTQIPQVPGRMDFGDLKLVIAESARKEIQKDVNMLWASEKFYRIKLDRALLYFPLIEKTFKEEGLPEDFKYLSLQESGLISDAVSSSNAVGFWQFKDFTGREVGLRIDSRIDERKNIVAASRGAATYLKRNNFLYDNWVYALTAYYAGPGGATRYVNKDNYGAKKMEINKKTHWYVKRFLAHKVAFEGQLNNKHSEGLSLVTYTKGEGKNLDRIAKEFDIEPDLIQHYNKWIRNGKIPDDKQYHVIIPIQGKVKNSVIAKTQEKESTIREPNVAIKETEKRTYPKEINPGLSDQHAVPMQINGVNAILSGKMDNLNSLAAEAGISPDRFMKYNDMRAGQEIVPGEVYYTEKKRGKARISFHIARKGETLWDVAQRYGIRLSKLARNNRMEESSKLREGRVLWMDSRRPKDSAPEYHTIKPKNNLVAKVASAETTPIPPKPISTPKKKNEPMESTSPVDSEPYTPPVRKEWVGDTHEVQPGDTFWSISQQYEISLEELMEWNQLTKYDTLRVKQKLFVEAPTEKIITAKNKEFKIYTVKPGDTMYSIAKANGMGVTELMDLNDKRDPSLSVGEELKVYR